jgi:hypothetical protein
MEGTTAKRVGFDSQIKFEVRIPHPEFDKGKPCTLRFPTDEEWARRARQHVTVRRLLGRDATKTEVPKARSADAELFEKIRLDKEGPEFDEFEASAAIARISRAEIIGVEREGKAFRISLKVAGCTVVHILRVPTQREAMEFGDSAVSSVGHRRHTETRFALEPSAGLWDKVKIAHEGYAGEIPIIHKDAAVTELLMQVQVDTSDDDPED